MKRKLIIANTYYQLIIAMQLNETLFVDDEIILLLSNHSRNTEEICERLCKLQIFKEVHYFKTKDLLKNRKIPEKIKDFFQISFGCRNRYTDVIKGLEGRFFDEIICYNYGVDVEGLFSYLYEANNGLKVSFYEEGILTYGIDKDISLRQKCMKWLRLLLGKRNVTEVYENFYCFYPSLYKGVLKAVSIPHVKSFSKCADELKELFGLFNIGFQYPEKYIFFTSVYDFEGGNPIGEYELVSKVADFVGKNNLLIKVHPRDTRGIYERDGYKVDINSSIPWEAIQLSGDFRDKIFLTATSGSVLAGSLMSEIPTRTFYMFKCCNITGNISAKITAKSIKDLLSDSDLQEVLGNVSIVQKVEEIIK